MWCSFYLTKIRHTPPLNDQQHPPLFAEGLHLILRNREDSASFPTVQSIMIQGLDHTDKTVEQFAALHQGLTPRELQIRTGVPKAISEFNESNSTITGAVTSSPSKIALVIQLLHHLQLKKYPESNGIPMYFTFHVPFALRQTTISKRSGGDIDLEKMGGSDVTVTSLLVQETETVSLSLHNITMATSGTN